jgi:hypothetical protein
MTNHNGAHTTYYTDMQPRLMKDYDKVLKHTRKVLKDHFDDAKIDQVLDACRREFASLIPTLPYIGGKQTTSTTNLIGGAWGLAIIFVLEREGLDERAIGYTIYKTMELAFYARPRWLRWLMGKMMMTKPFLNKMRAQATAPYYPGGWRKVIVEDNAYDFGQDVTECGIVTLFQQHGKEQYTPYMCLGDFPMFRSMGIGLTRTQTIGNGAPICDFRFNKRGETPPGWPPENLEEFNPQGL